MANTSLIPALWSVTLLHSEPLRLRRTRSLSFASFTERERRYLMPMNLFAMRQKKRAAQAVPHE